jgi:histidine triad (HIT) family protein
VTALDSDCIFCKIGAGTLPANAVYRDSDAIAIEDLNPQAPTHLLVMTVRHHANIAALAEARDDALLAKLMGIAARLGRERGGADGFRLVINSGPSGGQTVDHLHVHVLAGRPMSWPPG